MKSNHYISNSGLPKSSSKLPIAQGTTLTKIQLSLIPTRTMKKNKLLLKFIMQMFQITDIKLNTVEKPFNSKKYTNI